MEQEWISLNEFMRRNRMGYETAKKMMHEGKVEYQKIGVQYRIKISKNEVINEDNKKLLEEITELKTYLRAAKKFFEQIEV